MATLQEIQARLTQCYFSQPERQIELMPGQVLREQDEFNDRLYYVIRGSLIGTIRGEDDDGEETQVTMFEANQGAYIGMHSFFSNDSQRASSRVTAKTASVLAWIDDYTTPVEPEVYGSIREQFMRVIIEELFCRQMSLRKATTERERVMRQLHESERLSMLGQLAAGISHELNNAISVINSSSFRLSGLITELAKRYEPQLSDWFERGCQYGQRFSSQEIRKWSPELAKRYRISASQAKTLARIIGDERPERLPDNLEQALMLWGAGCDFHDMLVAARHATNIVRSVKQLGRNENQEFSQVDIHQTIRETITLLKSQLRAIQVTLDLAESEQPTLWGNATELVQVWVNIIKNACDALTSSATEKPEIVIATQIRQRFFHITIANNGPPIPKELKEKIFQPKFTTKKDENCIGLGLGLYIVQRIVSGYSGRIRLESNNEQTIFHIILPLTTAPSDENKE